MNTNIRTSFGEVNLFQNYKNVEGISCDCTNKLGIQKEEIWKKSEIDKLMLLMNDPDIGEFIKKLFWDKETKIPEIPELLDFINSKRAYKFKNSADEVVMVAIPKNRILKEGQLNHYSNLLFRIVLSHWYWINESDPDKKVERRVAFNNAIQGLRVELAKRIFSKNFSEKYRMKFIGFNSVALTAAVEMDQILVPRSWSESRHIKVGDLCIVKRDPLQNLFVCCKVAGFTEEEVIRLNVHTFALLDGDFDGDNIAVVPVKLLVRANREFFGSISNIKRLYAELRGLKPTLLLKNPKMDKLTREYK